MASTSTFPGDPAGAVMGLLHLLLGAEAKEARGASPPKGLDQPMDRPFTCLENGTFLHNRPEKDIYRILIDSYRFRMEEHCFSGKKPAKGSIYATQNHGLPGFKRYLDLAASRDGLLPSWWTPQKKRECIDFGMGGVEWQNLHEALDQPSVMWQYGDSRFPQQLRMLAEVVYETPVDRVSTFGRRRELAEMEARLKAQKEREKREKEEKEREEKEREEKEKENKNGTAEQSA